MMLKSIGIAATAVVGVLATAQPSSAQATACALSGEYVLTASGVARASPSQLAGSFVFSPPATCAPGIGGKVSIDVAWLSPTGESQTFHSTFPYSVEGLVLNIEGGLAVGDLSGITDGLATSVALVAGPAQASLGVAIAGTIVRRALPMVPASGPTAVAGATGGTGPTGAVGSGTFLMARLSMSLSGASFVAVNGNSSAQTDEAVATLIVPVPCTVRNLRADFTGTIAARTISFRRNGLNTALSCSVRAGAPICTNSSDTVALAAGDTMSYEVTGGAQPGFSAYISAVCQ